VLLLLVVRVTGTESSRWLSGPQQSRLPLAPISKFWIGGFTGNTNPRMEGVTDVLSVLTGRS